MEAALAVVDILTDQAERVGYFRRSVMFEAMDPEDRLVQWLNEIIYLTVVDGFLTESGLVLLQGDRLFAELSGEDRAWGKVVTELKSATYHSLVLTRGPDECRAQVVIDV